MEDELIKKKKMYKAWRKLNDELQKAENGGGVAPEELGSIGRPNGALMPARLKMPKDVKKETGL